MADNEVGHVHHRWLADVQRDMQTEYERLHAVAVADPQQAGHGAESAWVRLLEEWRPPNYEVAKRRYIIPEEGDDKFETDIVVFNPAYPRRLRDREEVLAGGVAAAFSVKLSLDSGGITDAIERSLRLRRSLKRRVGSPRQEMLAPFAVGLLAHAHVWTSPGSEPAANVTRGLEAGMSIDISHPRELLDLVCVANLGTWTTSRTPYMPPRFAPLVPGLSDLQRSEGYASTAIMVMETRKSPTPIAVFLAHLLLRLSYDDPQVRPLADAFRLTNTLGAAVGKQWFWNLGDVFTDRVRVQLPIRGLQGMDSDWAASYI